MKLETIFEDRDLLVIDKPAGIETTSGPSGEESVESQVKFRNVERNGIVHRLDKDTSGVLIIAKTPEAYENLKKQFAEHIVEKVYTTLVFGKTENRGEIRSFIVRDPKRKQAMKAISYLTGLERGKLREAKTSYRKIEEIAIDNDVASLLEVKIETGRTHQIRVHMQSIGHPVLGDAMYNTKTSKRLSKKIGLKRQFLHASRIELTHPKSGKKVKFESPLAPELDRTVSSIM